MLRNGITVVCDSGPTVILPYALPARLRADLTGASLLLGPNGSACERWELGLAAALTAAALGWKDVIEGDPAGQASRSTTIPVRRIRG